MPKMLSIFVHSCRAENKEHYLKPKMPEIKSSGNSVFVVLFSTKEKFEKEKMKYVMSERQKKALQYANEHGKITNSEFRKLFPDITDRTALNDLTDLVSKKILAKKGKTKSAYYIIPK
ncbi:hypothetical protein D4Q76_00265 [archaeon]|nr:MAG: hypothetical protein D4Q76_00265 [archaeon]